MSIELISKSRISQKIEEFRCYVYHIIKSFSFLDTNRSMPEPYDNRAFENDPSRINFQPANEIIAVHSPRRMPPTTEITAGRTKLHHLLDEVLDKAESDEVYDPDSETERQKRRRQRRRGLSTSDDHNSHPFNNTNPQSPHIPVIPQVSERPDPSYVRLRYNPYEAGDRAHDISRLPPVVLKPKYASDDQHYNQYSSRSNPPLFYDDSNIADRAATATDAFATPKRFGKTRIETDREATMRHDGGEIERRQHKFNDDAVYIDTISKNRDGYRVQARTAWVDPHLDDEPVRQNDYITARKSAANTRNIISSINNELQYIASPSSEEYHA
jgi:hypothetical protein